ncbi:FAD dependent oxidoreductase [Nemania serpens]|nr:FAD dependent oxidoreductase [Nemania serpens]
MAPLSKSDPIIIVGAGTFGLSTALHLAQAGYHNITIFDKGADIPSGFSAANHVNKILRAEYDDDFKTNLAVEALKAWEIPLFAPHYHRTGFLHCASGEGPQKAINTLNSFRASAEKYPEVKKHIIPLDNRSDIVRAVGQLQDGSLPGWKGYLNRYDGYAHAAHTLIAMHEACIALNVRFFLGEASEPNQKVTGVKTRQNTAHNAKIIIEAAGAAATSLLPSLGRPVTANSWSIADIKRTEAEASALRGIPHQSLKIAPMGSGFTNTNPETGISRPPSTAAESAFMPPGDERRVRKLVAQTLPSLADRPFVDKRLCWFADTTDSEYISDFVPDTLNSFVVVSGDSGHGFKMLPIVGANTRPDNTLR